MKNVNGRIASDPLASNRNIMWDQLHETFGRVFLYDMFNENSLTGFGLIGDITYDIESAVCLYAYKINN